MPNQAITLEQLADLNAEIAALARAGVPLERALKDLGGDLPGNVGRVTSELARRLEQGGNLADVVARSDDLLPPMYRAVVVAGLRSGQLPVALQAISTTVRRVAQIRRLVGVSLLYPLVVLAIAYGFFVWMSVAWAPVMAERFREFDVESIWLEALAAVGRLAVWWAPWVPIIFLLLLGVWWHRSARSPLSGRTWMGFLPSVGRLVRSGQLATFAEVLGLLIEQEVPLVEALPIAADASGNKRLASAAQALAGRIERGDETGKDLPGGIPPLLGWMIATCKRPSDLSRSLAVYADSHHERAMRAGRWAAVYIPILLAAGLGGTVVALLAIGTLGPWFDVLYDLAKPN